MSARAVERIVEAMPSSDGAGVRLLRSLGSPMLDHLDPFLLLDEFRSDDPNDYIAGFPDHPHRGFETVTYMLAGHMEHRDHMGNRGDLGPGSVQWMTAGRGIIHSEMPRQEQGLMWGFQMWINLPAADKMTAPRYQDIPPDAVPEVTLPGGGLARVVIGKVGDTDGAVSSIATDPLYLDVHLPAGAGHSQPVDPGHNAFCYVYEGEAQIGGQSVAAHHLAVFGPGDSIQVQGASDTRLLMVAARPLGEPIARHGPFVMNTRAEIMQAVQDYQSGRLIS